MPGGALSHSLIDLGRALRRAGVPVDSAQIALAHQSVLLTGLENRADFCAGLESVLINREQDRAIFREMLDACLLNARWQADAAPQGATPVAPFAPKAQAENDAGVTNRRPGVQEALATASSDTHGDKATERKEEPPSRQGLSASDMQRLQQADFRGLTAMELRVIETLIRDLPLPLPHIPSRRLRPADTGHALNWPGVLRQAARTGGEIMALPRWQRKPMPLPVLVLVDISGSMSVYARLLLAFLHAATRELSVRHVFAFGTGLVDLNRAFSMRDPDAMLEACNQSLTAFAEGTRLGESLRQLRLGHAQALCARRTLVLLVTDGLDTGSSTLLANELDWIKRRSRRLLWLNPLLRFDAYTPIARGAAVLHDKVDGMQAIHNLTHLRQLAGNLASLIHR